MRWRADEKVAWQSVGEEVVVMDLVSGKAMGLNATGSYVWTRLAQLDEEQIASDLAARFGIEPGRASEDVRGFLAQMAARGLIVPDQS